MKKYLSSQKYLQYTLGIFALLALVLGAGQVLAWQNNSPVQEPSQLHPVFAMLDANGENVLTSGQPVSTMKTCGECHDTAFIESHSFHSDLGLSSYATVEETWNASEGKFGKWDPLAYRYLSQEGDERLDMGTAEWLMRFGTGIVGGGPATTSRNGKPLTSLGANSSNPETAILDPKTGKTVAWNWKQSGVMEMNCFLCHFESPNSEARATEIETGRFGWANTATLLGSGLVEKSGNDYAWNADAFDEEGNIKKEFIFVQEPTNDNCAQCHGEVHSDLQQPLTFSACDTNAPHTATTGQVIAAQKISASGINLSNKNDLNRAWDIHAERALQCTSCHFSLNNPVQAERDKELNPSHLVYDPRKLGISEYLLRPNHNFARGQSAQYTVAPDIKGTMRRCESCHDAVKSHASWLPYTKQHMAEVACESCHIPQLFAPAIESYDWTVLHTDGTPASECRGIEGNNTITNLVKGYEPVLMQRTNIDGQELLAPYNLISTWYWVYDDANGNTRPVRELDLKAAYLSNGKYADEILAVFDTNKDGNIDNTELKIDSKEKENVVATRLSALGLGNPRIQGQIQPYSINHNVTNGEYAINDCETCHSATSRITQTIQLAAYAPAGVVPTFVSDSNVNATGSISTNEDGALFYTPVTKEDGLYIFGHNRVNWIDWLGALIFVGTLAAVGGHGTLRYIAAIRRPRTHAPKVKRVYMYESYERFWHWLQTASIVILLFTGLVIHRPDIFGIFSFPYMVTIHNVVAAILALNAALSLFWHVTTGQIHQYIPRPRGFIDDAIVQAKFYIDGIFKHKAHPFEKTPEKKLNPLQQLTYFGLLNVLLPLQGLTGIMMWGVQEWPQIANWFGGLPVLAPIHSLIAWLFGTFIVAHIYLTTTGATPLEAMRGMITGWEEIESHDSGTHEHAEHKAAKGKKK